MFLLGRKIESYDVGDRIADYIQLSRGLEGVMEGIGDVCNTNGDMVSICNGNKKIDSRVRKKQIIRNTKVNKFYLGITVLNMEGEVPVNVFGNIIDLGG